MDKLFGGIEFGGTKTICAVGNEAGKIAAQAEIPTGTPDETFPKIVSFFKSQPQAIALGAGCFGPVDLKTESKTFGFITNTPKIGWSNTDVRGTLRQALNLSIEIETDVNCAAIGEHFYGAAKGQENFVYLSVGTGIGASAVSDGKLLHGTSHPEMGHMRIPHDLTMDPFTGSCPYHGDCFEGLASGPSIEKRVGQKGEHVIDPMRWDFEALYLSLGLSNLIAVFSPSMVILGGGVMNHGGLLEEVIRQTKIKLSSYLAAPEIVAASRNNAVLGAIKLAATAHTAK